MGNYSPNDECYAACGAKGPDDCIWSDNLATGRLGRGQSVLRVWGEGKRRRGGGRRKRREEEGVHSLHFFSHFRPQYPTRASLHSATRSGPVATRPPNSLVVRRSLKALNSRKILSDLPAEEANSHAINVRFQACMIHFVTLGRGGGPEIHLDILGGIRKKWKFSNFTHPHPPPPPLINNERSLSRWKIK